MKRDRKPGSSQVDRLLACQKETKVKNPRYAKRAKKKGQSSDAFGGFGPQAAASFRNFCKSQGSASEDESMIALLSGLGHVADGRGLDFYELVSSAIGHWHIERCEPFSHKYVNVDIDVSAPQ